MKELKNVNSVFALPSAELLKLIDKVATEVMNENDACDFNLEFALENSCFGIEEAFKNHINRHGSTDNFNFSFTLKPFFYMDNNTVEHFSCFIPATESMWDIKIYYK